MNTRLDKLNNASHASSQQNILMAEISCELDENKKGDYLQYNHDKKMFGECY